LIMAGGKRIITPTVEAAGNDKDPSSLVLIP
jgi:hypothetical protein